MTDFCCNNTTALALGNFDGLHEGHLQVLSAVAQQKQNGMQPVLVRFEPHPVAVFRGTAPDRLLTDRTYNEVLNAFGMQQEVLNFLSVCEMSPECFVSEILVKKLHAGFVACGFNFHFGKNGVGCPSGNRLHSGRHPLQRLAGGSCAGISENTVRQYGTGPEVQSHHDNS